MFECAAVILINVVRTIKLYNRTVYIPWKSYLLCYVVEIIYVSSTTTHRKVGTYRLVGTCRKVHLVKKEKPEKYTDFAISLSFRAALQNVSYSLKLQLLKLSGIIDSSLIGPGTGFMTTCALLKLYFLTSAYMI